MFCLRPRDLLATNSQPLVERVVAGGCCKANVKAPFTQSVTQLPGKSVYSMTSWWVIATTHQDCITCDANQKPCCH